MADNDDGMVDMKLSPEARANDLAYPMGASREYSYGLNLRLENNELEKLEIKRLPGVGDEFEIRAIAKVTNVYESQSEGNRSDRAVQLQITKMKVR